MSADLFDRNDLQSLTEEAMDILARAKERFKPVATFALFSGGNDSTAATFLVRKHVDAAVHISTGIGIMEKGRTALDHVQACCEAWGLPLNAWRNCSATIPSVASGCYL